MGSGQSTDSGGTSGPSPDANLGNVPTGDQIIIAIDDTKDSNLTSDKFQTIVDATNVALPEFCAAWGFPKVTVVVGTGWQRGCFGTITLTDKLVFNSQTSSLGYHTLDANGRPIAVVDYNAHLQDNRQILGYTSDFTGINSTNIDKAHAYLSSTFSHEVFEMLVDPDLNNSLISPGQQIIFRSNVTGGYYPIAREVCDPVSSFDFMVEVNDTTRVSISNYVLPSWFFKDGVFPYDAAQQVKTPLTVLKQGTDYVSTSQYKVVYNTLKGWVMDGESSATY